MNVVHRARGIPGGRDVRCGFACCSPLSYLPPLSWCSRPVRPSALVPGPADSVPSSRRARPYKHQSNGEPRVATDPHHPDLVYQLVTGISAHQRAPACPGRACCCASPPMGGHLGRRAVRLRAGLQGSGVAARPANQGGRRHQPVLRVRDHQCPDDDKLARLRSILAVARRGGVAAAYGQLH